MSLISGHPFSCFNCDYVGGGMYREHQGPTTRWFMGHAGGNGYFACADCAVLLFDAMPVDHNGDYEPSREVARPALPSAAPDVNGATHDTE